MESSSRAGASSLPNADTECCHAQSTDAYREEGVGARLTRVSWLCGGSAVVCCLLCGILGVILVAMVLFCTGKKVENREKLLSNPVRR
eukprot:1971681-Rhodomonas_salina.2